MNAQEAFWAGEFGDAYTERNRGRVEANKWFFGPILGPLIPPVRSVIEMGCGAGENLAAIQQIDASIARAGVEINASAAAIAGAFGTVVIGSFLHIPVRDLVCGRYKSDLVLTKGVLIHVAEEDLQLAYDVLYMSAKRYILVAEYYSKTPREIEYRGHAGRLWTRDFGGELLDKFHDLRLIECVFHYDRLTGQDNLTHWLLERRT